jgi:FkbM family methyltransferase
MAKKKGFSFAKMIGGGFAAVARGISALFGRRVGTRAAAHAADTMSPTVSVKTPRGTLRFWCGSAVAAKRSVGFMDHEPDTRDWIDCMVRPGDHIWDVGANIGAYTLYACLDEAVSVTAFEPVAGTFAVLARNILVNKFDGRATALCMALSNADGLVPIYLASTEPGAAMHALSAPETVRGRFEAQGTQTVLAMRGDELVTRLGVTKPDHVKIDVDGHELRVLEGLEGLLPSVRTVWVEMIAAADASGQNAQVDAFLTARGFAVQVLASGHKGRNRMYVHS